MLNKYGNISGGEIFRIMDNEAHKDAVEVIGECVTASSSIFFYNEIKLLGNYKIEIDTLKISNSKAQTSTVMFDGGKVVASAVFLFITRK